MITPAQAQAKLDEIDLKLENWAVRANAWLQLQLLSQREFYAAVAAGTYTVDTWPTAPFFH